MRDREQIIREEAAALWRELYGEPPPIRAEGAEMLDALLKAMPERGYDRMASPFLRPSQIARPRPADA